MANEDLKELKQRWYEQAQSDGSLGLCYLVGRRLGERLGVTYGPKYRWLGPDGIEIYVDDYGNYMIVKRHGKLICSTHTTNQLFVPGAWMEYVRQAAVPARQRSEEDECRQEQTERQRLLDELGMSE